MIDTLLKALSDEISKRTSGPDYRELKLIVDDLWAAVHAVPAKPQKRRAGTPRRRHNDEPQ